MKCYFPNITYVYNTCVLSVNVSTNNYYLKMFSGFTNSFSDHSVFYYEWSEQLWMSQNTTQFKKKFGNTHRTQIKYSFNLLIRLEITYSTTKTQQNPTKHNYFSCQVNMSDNGHGVYISQGD